MNLCKRLLWKELLTAVQKVKHDCNLDVFLFLSRRLSRLEQNHGFITEANLRGCQHMGLLLKFRVHKCVCLKCVDVVCGKWVEFSFLCLQITHRILKCTLLKASLSSWVDYRGSSCWSCLWEEKERVGFVWPLKSNRYRMKSGP